MKNVPTIKVFKSADESQNGQKMKNVFKNKLYRIPAEPLETPKRSFENNCYLRVLKGVLKIFGKSFSKEALDEIVRHISRDDVGFNLRDARSWLEPLEVDDIIETNVSVDRLRLAIKNKIPTVLIFKAPFDFSYDLKIKHKVKKGVKPNGAPFKYKVEIDPFSKFSNHAALLIGIDSKFLYMLDPMYKDGKVIAKVPIKSFEKKWAMEYDDRHGYSSPHFCRVERVAVFYFAYSFYNPPKIKNSVWKKKAENPIRHLNEVKKWREKSESVEKIVKEIRERYEFMKIHNYHDMEYAHLKSKLFGIFWKKHNLGKCDKEEADKLLKKLMESHLRLDKIDKKLAQKGIITNQNQFGAVKNF